MIRAFLVWGMMVGMVGWMVGCGDGGKSTGPTTQEDGRIFIQNDTDKDPEGQPRGTIVASYMDDTEGFREISVPVGGRTELTVNPLPGGTEVTIALETGGDVSGSRSGEAKITIDGNVTVRIISVGGRGASLGIKWEALTS